MTVGVARREHEERSASEELDRLLRQSVVQLQLDAGDGFADDGPELLGRVETVHIVGRHGSNGTPTLPFAGAGAVASIGAVGDSSDRDKNGGRAVRTPYLMSLMMLN